MKALLATVAALLVAVPAAGHFEQDESKLSASSAGRFLFMQTDPSPALEGKPFDALLAINDEADFSAVTGADVALVVAGEPHAARETVPGTYAVELALPRTGVHDVVWEFPASDGARATWNATVTVYRDLGVATVPAEAEADLYANTTATIGIKVVNATTGEPDPRVEDVVLRLERWSDDHKVMLGSDEHAAAARDDAWWVTARIGDPGMLHIKVGSKSLGMGFDDTPYIHQYVLPAELAPKPPVDDERPAPVAPLAALAALALAGAAARRR